MHFFCFLLFWESFNCCNFGTTGPVQVGFSTKCTTPNEDFNQIENWKCHMFDFGLIPLDCTTYRHFGANEVLLTYFFSNWWASQVSYSVYMHRCIPLVTIAIVFNFYSSLIQHADIECVRQYVHSQLSHRLGRAATRWPTHQLEHCQL